MMIFSFACLIAIMLGIVFFKVTMRMFSLSLRLMLSGVLGVMLIAPALSLLL